MLSLPNLDVDSSVSGHRLVPAATVNAAIRMSSACSSGSAGESAPRLCRGMQTDRSKPEPPVAHLRKACCSNLGSQTIRIREWVNRVRQVAVGGGVSGDQAAEEGHQALEVRTEKRRHESGRVGRSSRQARRPPGARTRNSSARAALTRRHCAVRIRWWRRQRSGRERKAQSIGRNQSNHVPERLVAQLGYCLEHRLGEINRHNPRCAGLRQRKSQVTCARAEVERLPLAGRAARAVSDRQRRCMPKVISAFIRSYRAESD